MVVDNLLRVTFEHLLRCRAKAFSLGIGGVEIDDRFDAHGACPPEIAVCVARKAKVYVY